MAHIAGMQDYHLVGSPAMRMTKSQAGRGILGVIDGATPREVEEASDIIWRKNLLRKIGYKLWFPLQFKGSLL